MYSIVDRHSSAQATDLSRLSRRKLGQVARPAVEILLALRLDREVDVDELAHMDVDGEGELADEPLRHDRRSAAACAVEEQCQALGLCADFDLGDEEEFKLDLDEDGDASVKRVSGRVRHAHAGHEPEAVRAHA
jgi:hypothetical protein